MYQAASLFLLGVLGAPTGQSAAQTVTFSVAEINAIAIAGKPSLDVAVSLAPGGTGAVVAETTYAITTNGSGKEVVAALASPLPSGVELVARASAPTAGGKSAGEVVLSTQGATLVTGVTRLAEPGMRLVLTVRAKGPGTAALSVKNSVSLSLR